MALSKSAITYAIVALMVLWVLLGAITLPNASRWFRGTSYSIQESIISFNLTNSNNIPITISNAITEKHGNRVFISNVYAINNTPSVPKDGLQGVLFDLQEACGDDTKVIQIPKIVQQYNISKIALIRQSTSCFLSEKLLHAQKNGATGAIVFHNSTSTNDPLPHYDSMGVSSRIIEIPAYYVDMNTGLTLLKDLESLSKSNQNKDKENMDLMIRVVLSPSDKPILDHWQFALIVVAVMLVTSILAITVLQCHMWHMAQNRFFNASNNETLTEDEQRQLAMDENYWRGITGQPLQPLAIQLQKRKQRLEQAVVNLLPTRVYKNNKNDDTITDSKEKLSEVLQSDKNVSVDSFGTTCEASSCVICLESFITGDILRRLPCNHEYHRDCIDVWLTKKCGTCPLCQQFVEIPTVPNEIHAREEEERHMYECMPDLAETWTGLTRDEQIAIRQAPWASQNNTERPTSREIESRRSQENESTNLNPYPPV